MFHFVQKTFGGLLGHKGNPIGVDFGTDSLKMAQVAWDADEPRLIAAASAEVPGHVRHNLAARMAFFAEAARELLSSAPFKGRRVVMALPAASMQIQHIRLAKMDDEMLKKALPWEARGKLSIDPSHALLRHLIAGDVYQDSEPKYEVILMAAARDLVHQLIDAAAKARLDVVGMSVEPSAIVDCFGHIYLRKADHEAVNCFVDIGCASSRAYIALGSRILFARSIKIGGEHMTRAVASQLKMSVNDARMLRLKVCHQQIGLDDAHGHPDIEANDAPRDQQAQVTEACREPLDQLAAELDLCRRYHEQTFPDKPVSRLVFVGGEARHRSLCHHIAREMSLAAQVGDPLIRMGHTTSVGIESGLDRRLPQPGWAAAIGLSLGPKGASAATETTTAPASTAVSKKAVA